LIHPDLQRLHTNQRLLLEELIARGAGVEVLDIDRELVRVHYHGREHYLVDRTSEVVAYVPAVIAGSKFATKRLLLEAGIRAPAAGLFSEDTIEEAVDFAKEKDFRVVFKPNDGSHGKHVETDIRDAGDLEMAIDRYLSDTGGAGDYLVEEFVEGMEHRVFITTRGDYAVLQREPSHVIGDGLHTLEELAAIETQRRAEEKRARGSALCPVAIDASVRGFLEHRGKHLSDVPARGEKAYLRQISNLALGGVSRDMTHVADPSVIRIAKEVLASFKGLAVVGIDFITTDITQEQENLPYGIIEVNANPGLSMHVMPAIGDPQPVAKYLADVMFPD
jgi:cyanophycin synthetase